MVMSKRISDAQSKHKIKYHHTQQHGCLSDTCLMIHPQTKLGSCVVANNRDHANETRGQRDRLESKQMNSSVVCSGWRGRFVVCVCPIFFFLIFSFDGSFFLLSHPLIFSFFILLHSNASLFFSYRSSYPVHRNSQHITSTHTPTTYHTTNRK